jgi:hypothetical protein
MKDPNDRRDSYRFDPRHARVVLRTLEGQALEVLDLSASGTALLAPRDLVARLQGATTIIDLGDRSFSTNLDVVRAITDQRGLMRIGTRFRALDREALGHLSEFLIEEFAERGRSLSRLNESSQPALIIRDARFIRRVLRLHAIDGGHPIRVYSDQELLPVTLHARDSKNAFERDFGVDAEGEYAAIEAGRTYTFLVASAGAVYVFSSEARDKVGPVFTIGVPAEIQQKSFRDSFRVPIGGAEPHASITFRHPFLEEVVVRRMIREVAGRGFSFEIDPKVDILFPGSRIGELLLELPEGPITASGIVRNLSHADRSGRCNCGVEILAFSRPQHGDSWHAFVLGSAHEHVRLKDKNAVGKAWNILNASEYMTLWTPRALKPHLARQFADAWFKMSEQFGRILLLNNDVRTIGTAAANLLYPKTWIVHHLGIDKEERTPAQKEQFLLLTRELYSAALFLLAHQAHPEYFVLYVEKSKRWNERLYGDFVANYSTTADFIYSDLCVYKRRLADRVEEIPAGEITFDIVEEDAQLLLALSTRLAALLPAIEIDAFSYDRRDIDLGTFTLTCAKEGYERGRRVFFALEGARPIAALIAENGSEGVNVFGLLNTCRLFPVEGSEDEVKRARQLLLAKAADHYRSLGKREFLLLDAREDVDEEIVRLGFALASPGVRWLVRRNVVPAWLSYIDDLFRSKA